MANPSFVGNTSFRTVEESQFVDGNGIDRVRVLRVGRASDLPSEKERWQRGVNGSFLDYPYMYLQTRAIREGGRSSFVTVELEFAGFTGETLVNPISVEDDITPQTVTLVSDEPDESGQTQNVQCQYNAQTTTTTWLHNGEIAPQTPAFPMLISSTVPTGNLYNFYPASYTGTLQSKNVGRLANFRRIQLAEGAWMVIETWISRIEPAD